MTTMSLRRVDQGWIKTAPFRFSNSVDLAITPEQLFEVLADAEAWPKWAKVITRVTWTSPQPYGVGTTRTVDMLGAGRRRGVSGLGAEPVSGVPVQHLLQQGGAFAEYTVVETRAAAG
jgi:hypothetical protein